MNNLDRATARVAKLTDNNDHTEALKHVVRYAYRRTAQRHDYITLADNLIKAYNAVTVLHNWYGHMTDELRVIRKTLQKKTWSLLSEHEQREFNKVL